MPAFECTWKEENKLFVFQFNIAKRTKIVPEVLETLPPFSLNAFMITVPAAQRLAVLLYCLPAAASRSGLNLVTVFVVKIAGRIS